MATIEKFDLDLDALVDEKKVIRLNGKTIEISQPSLEAYLNLMKISKKLDSSSSVAQIEKAFELFFDIFNEISPNIKKAKPTLTQCMGLIEYIGTMVKPTSTKYLEANGIVKKSGDGKKK